MSCVEPNVVHAALGTLNSVIFPVGVISPILLLPVSVNQRFPHAATIPVGFVCAVGRGYSTTVPLAVTLPILLPSTSVNHTPVPGGPSVIPQPPNPLGTLNCLKTAGFAGCSSRIFPAPAVVYHALLDESVVTPSGAKGGVYVTAGKLLGFKTAICPAVDAM